MSSPLDTTSCSRDGINSAQVRGQTSVRVCLVQHPFPLRLNLRRKTVPFCLSVFICKPRPAATLGLQILGVNTHPWMRCGLGGVGRILPTPPPPTFPVPRYRSSDHPNTTSPAINNCRSRAHPPNIYTFAYSMPPLEYPILDTVQRILPNRTTDNQKKKSFCTKL